MTKGFYMPKGDKEKELWLMNFATQFSAVATNLGFTAADVTSVNNDYAAYKFMVDIVEIFKTETQERTRYKDLLADGTIGSPLGNIPTLPTLPAAPVTVGAGVFKRIAMIVQRIKNHPNYNEATGRNLGIIGAEKVVNLDAVKPKINRTIVESDQIVIEWTKGLMDGVVVFSANLKQLESTETPTDLDSVTEWVEIGRVTHSPFVDLRLNKEKKPETRLYKLRYFKNDVQVGKESDIIRVLAEVYNRPESDPASKLK
ncbi:MAG: hypothetical protein V2A54_10260 [Bacteroidota bacterium]